MCSSDLRRNFDVPTACAAKIKARLVTDFEPGITTRTSTGFLPRKGAGQFATALLSFEVIWAILSRLRACKFLINSLQLLNLGGISSLEFATCVAAMRKPKRCAT